MITIIRRKDNTSICCSSINKRQIISPVKTKIIGFTIACTLLVVGFIIIISTV